MNFVPSRQNKQNAHECERSPTLSVSQKKSDEKWLKKNIHHDKNRTRYKRACFEHDRRIPSEDVAIVGTALAGHADFLITGDKGLLALERYENILILSPRTFVEKWKKL